MEAQLLLKSIIGRIATGPELSKNIDFEEAKLAMQSIIRGEIDPVQAAIFLIALRMKRETMEENKGILAAILSESDRQIADVDILIDIGDPYNGYNRSIPISPFLPPLLAELGLPTIIHGLDSITPKFGLTHKHIYKNLDIDVDKSSFGAKSQIENKKIAWAYLDQAYYCTKLNQLLPLRNKIIKRTVINTVETLIAPIRAKNTHIILGYVHKPYPPIYAELASASGLDSALLVRGVEGGVIPSLRQVGLMISYDKENERARIEVDPKKLGIHRDLRAIPLPEKKYVANNINALAKHAIVLGKEALAGEKGIFYDGLVYGASLILYHTKRTDNLPDAAEMVRMVLNSGKARTRLENTV